MVSIQVPPTGTAPPELKQHGEQVVAAEPGPPRSQRHHERAGQRLYKRIEAVAATIEAEWAEGSGLRDWRSYAPPSAIC
jgi:hypothetical protein